MPTAAKGSSPLKAILQMHEKIEEALADRSFKLRVRWPGHDIKFDKQVFINHLRIIPQLVHQIAYMAKGLKMIADAPNEGCANCTATSHLAADILVGKENLKR